MRHLPHRRTSTVRYFSIITITLLLFACTMFPSEQQLRYQPNQALDVDTATRLAAKAMLQIEFIPQKQNDAAGFVQGVRNEKDFMGFHQGFYMIVKISKDAGGELVIDVKSQAGGEVAMSDMPSKYLQQFLKAYEPMLQRKLQQQPQPGQYKARDEYAL